MIDRILIVGLGSIGQRHLRLARELLPKAQIAVLRHQKHQTLPEHADHCYSSMVEALAFEPQIAVIANPATFHIDAARRLAEAGVHLLIEKPLSASTDGIAELLDAVQQHNTVLATAYNLRFLPSLQQFKSMLDDKLIGEVWSVRSEVGHDLAEWRPDSDYRKSVSAQHSLGGGALLELSHELDYLRWIFGEVDWVQAVLSKQSDLEIDVEDTAYMILGFPASNAQSQLVASVNMDFIRQDMTRSCTAIGKLGTLRWNGVTGTVELYAVGETEWSQVYAHCATRDESYIAEWHDFLACIEQGTKPLVGAEDGLRVLEIIEAARLASKTVSRVSVTITSTNKTGLIV